MDTTQGPDMAAVRDAFESFGPAVLAAAYNRVGGDDAVDRLWAEVRLGDSTTSAVVYEVAGERLGSVEIGRRLNLDGETAEKAMVEEIAGVAAQFRSDIEAAGAQVPRRIVLRYDVHAENMASTLDYEPVSESGLEWETALIETGEDGIDDDGVLEISEELSEKIDAFVAEALSVAFDLVHERDVDIIWVASSFAPLSVRVAYGMDGLVLLGSEVPAHIGVDDALRDKVMARLKRLGEELVDQAKELGEDLPPGLAVAYDVDGETIEPAIMEDIETGDPEAVIDGWLKAHQ